MGKIILYSAVSGTDPISKNRDGSLLHICRKYKPDKVVLLLSSEICEIHKHDNRYEEALKRLGEEIHHDFEIVPITKPNLIDVHEIGTVYPIIKENINDITKGMSESDILLVNISSGTPAMKYTQQFIATIGKYKILPISVASPEPNKIKNHDKKQEPPYDLNEIWKNNKDNNADEYKDRCIENTDMAMLSDFYKITLTEFVNNYNYSAALTLINSMPMLSTPEITEAIEGAHARLQLQIADATSKFANTGFKFPYTDDKKEVFEYALSLGIKLKKNEIADFVRAVTPVMTDLYIRTLKKLFNFDISRYTDRTLMRWDDHKLTRDPYILSILNGCFNNNFNTHGFVANIHLSNLLLELEDDGRAICPNNSEKAKAVDAIKRIGEFESKIRNQTAHTMVSMTSSTVKRETNYTPEQIYNDIKTVMEYNDIGKDEWDSYDKMNKVIIDIIKK
ncbi:MAG: hypothetical protein U0L18_11505 [Acutalibacteraceae bacterium]|nr:hypothetical protein [Acutalibacteraceae bacterium]